MSHFVVFLFVSLTNQVSALAGRAKTQQEFAMSNFMKEKDLDVVYVYQ